MAGPLPSPRKAAASTGPDLHADDAWSQHVSTLAAQGIAEPGSAGGSPPHRPATEADLQALYSVAPSFADLLPWVEYLPGSKSMLLEDGQSVAGFFELAPVGTEGREMAWLWQARDALENALQDSFDELDENPWVVQLYAQDESTWDNYLRGLADYVRPRAQGSAFTDFYLRFFGHHLRAIAKPGGLFEDTTVTRLPWRGQVRRVRMVVYRRVNAATASRRGQSPEQALTTICDRLLGGLANAGVKSRR
ncbi:MAG: conjugal transfer protein TraC, partial [Pseudomonadota bacterium]|nr:conjugal transfer protein TraC [Pseudomonadota bacterium]